MTSDSYRVIYTTPNGEDRPSAPKSRDVALIAFNREVETIAAHPLRGKERIRVMSEYEWVMSRLVAGAV